MAYASARYEKWVNTKKGKETATKSKLKHQKKLRSTLEGRIILRYRRVKCEWGKGVADWWLKQEPKCVMCDKDVLYNKAPTRKKGRSNLAELVIDHDHKYTRKDYRNNPELLPRGLLCQRHNLALGMIKENTTELRRMIAYLKKNK